MLGKTHYAGGSCAALAAFTVMQNNGWLMQEASPITQLLMLYPVCMFFSVASDLDQGDNAIPLKSPEAVVMHKVLRLTGAKHRSWQTHSLYFTGVLCVLLFAFVFVTNAFVGVQGSVDWVYFRLATIGAISGLASHLILDALSTDGIWVLPGIKLRFVPHTKAFAVGGTWEKIVFTVLIVAIFFLLLNQALVVFDLSIPKVIKMVIP